MMLTLRIKIFMDTVVTFGWHLDMKSSQAWKLWCCKAIKEFYLVESELHSGLFMRAP